MAIEPGDHALVGLEFVRWHTVTVAVEDDELERLPGAE
jgi:hypothetical protein